MLAPPTRTTHLTIAHSWDGTPIAKHKQFTLELNLTQEAMEIRFEGPANGDPPPPGPAAATMGLWEYEVVELFVAEAGGDDQSVRYTELEFSPHGHFLALGLEGVRNIVHEHLPLQYTASVHEGHWRGQASIALSELPPLPWRINATAIHGTGAQRTYLSAVRLPGEQPDFHQPGCFVGWS